MSTANIHSIARGPHQPGSLTHRGSVSGLSRDSHIGGDFYGNTFSGHFSHLSRPNKPHQVHLGERLPSLACARQFLLLLFSYYFCNSFFALNCDDSCPKRFVFLWFVFWLHQLILFVNVFITKFRFGTKHFALCVPKKLARMASVWAGVGVNATGLDGALCLVYNLLGSQCRSGRVRNGYNYTPIALRRQLMRACIQW